MDKFSDQNDWAFHIYTMAKTGKIDTNSFAGAMVHTYSKADSGNREAINEAFPALAREWAKWFKDGAAYISNYQAFEMSTEARRKLRKVEGR